MPRADATARSVYEDWHARVQSDDAQADRPWHDLLFKHLAADDVTGKRVLEIGCGRGELACHLAERAPGRYVAADFAHSAVQLGRARAERAAAAGVSWMVASIEEIALPEAWFDTAISCETIEHLVNPVQALREIHRVLRPGGRVLLTTPNYMGPLGLYRGYLRATGRRYTEGGQPICRLTSLPRTLAWFRRAGFRVTAVDGVGHYLPWPGRPPREMPRLDAIRPLRWVALHSLVVAEKPRAS